MMLTWLQVTALVLVTGALARAVTVASNPTAARLKVVGIRTRAKASKAASGSRWSFLASILFAYLLAWAAAAH